MLLEDTETIKQTFDNLMVLHLCQDDYFLLKVGHVFLLEN
jgi:hypothetical protein